MIIVADTSALFAGFDSAQREHRDAADVMDRETLVISPMVLTELDHLVHRAVGWPAAMQAMEALQVRISHGQYKLAELRPADLVTAHQVRRKYEALRLDLADAVGVILADRHRTDRIFTLDERDFRAIAPLTPGFSSFRLVPADVA